MKSYTKGMLIFCLFNIHFGLFSQWNKQIPQTDDTIWIDVNHIVSEQTAWLGGTEFFWNPILEYFELAEGYTYYYNTSDGGQNWKTGKFPISPTLSPFLTSIHAFDDKIAYATFYIGTTGENYVYQTYDGGTNWTKVANSTFTDPFSYVNAVSFKDTLNGIMMGDPTPVIGSTDDFFEIYRTSDAGKTWNRVPQSQIPNVKNREIGLFNEMTRVNDSIWFATTAGRIFSSIDGGSNWKADSVTPRGLINLRFVDSQHGVCIGFYTPNPARLLYTEDGGTNWQNVTPAFITSDNSYWSFCLIPESYYLFVTVEENNGGPYKSYISKDKGQNWIQINEGDGLNLAGFYNPKAGYAGDRQVQNQDHGTYIFTYVGNPLTGLLTPVKLKGDFRINPNPSKDFVTIDIQLTNESDVLLLLNDTNGKLILKKEFNAISSHQEYLDIRNISTGTYFITIATPEGHLVKRFVKQ